MKSDPQLKNRFFIHFAKFATEDDPQKKYRTGRKYYKEVELLTRIKDFL